MKKKCFKELLVSFFAHKPHFVCILCVWVVTHFHMTFVLCIDHWCVYIYAIRGEENNKIIPCSEYNIVRHSIACMSN